MGRKPRTDERTLSDVKGVAAKRKQGRERNGKDEVICFRVEADRLACYRAMAVTADMDLSGYIRHLLDECYRGNVGYLRDSIPREPLLFGLPQGVRTWNEREAARRREARVTRRQPLPPAETPPELRVFEDGVEEGVEDDAAGETLTASPASPPPPSPSQSPPAGPLTSTQRPTSLGDSAVRTASPLRVREEVASTVTGGPFIEVPPLGAPPAAKPEDFTIGESGLFEAPPPAAYLEKLRIGTF